MGTLRLRRAGVRAAAALVLLAVAGCGHHHKNTLPPATATAPALEEQPAAQPPYEGTVPPRADNGHTGRIPITPVPPHGITAADIRFVNTHRPLLTEVGYATWYRAPYRGRKAANGEVFRDDALTAAHRTLPMGSLIVVTNLKTGQWSAMRITDRGPFVEGRILDLTMASAKATGVYRAGVARVRVDVYETPKPIDEGGRWCVQIGAFHSERLADKLKHKLQREYPHATVIDFPGEKSYWVRIRPEGDDRERAELIAQRLHPVEGEAYLTRLD